MTIPDDVDVDALISQLAGPLTPADRAAFRDAADAALAAAPCLGPGLAYRIVGRLQRDFFRPPDIAATRAVSRWDRAEPHFDHGSKR